MPQIISTLSAGVNYTQYTPTPHGAAAEVVRMVAVKGGANVAQKRLVLLGDKSSHDGIATEVSDEELEFLESHPLFQTHKENGFIKVNKFKANANKVAKDLNVDNGGGKGGSSQLTLADAKTGGRIQGAVPAVNLTE